MTGVIPVGQHVSLLAETPVSIACTPGGPGERVQPFAPGFE